MGSYLLQASIATSITVTGYAILKKLIGDDQVQAGDGTLSAPKEVYGCRYIRLPSAVVGLIIGKKGANINRLQQESGCLLRVVYKEPSCLAGLQVESLDGFKESDQGPTDEEGRMPYLEVVAKKDSPLDYLHTLLSDTIKRSQERLVEEILFVSRQHIGFVVGKRGLHIRRICTDTRTSITIDDDLKNENADDCPSEKARIRIYGPESQVRVAADRIEDTIWRCIGLTGEQVNSTRDKLKLERSVEEQVNQIRAIEEACEKMAADDANWE